MAIKIMAIYPPNRLKKVDIDGNTTATIVEGMYPSDNGDAYWKL
jgi:hypothetical protein